ncbi:hypothetical protein BDR05DRAFT_952445 [Suillus weaverae]|nr:hypothetical protein BDR05DRAFT_952445 [Suillus weaverae]
MARRQYATFESSGSLESDSDSDSSSVEKSASSTEPLKGGKRKRKKSGNDNDDKMKSSKPPRLQKKDNEEPSYPEYTQDPGEIHLGGVQQVVITAIRAADLALGLRRIPLASMWWSRLTNGTSTFFCIEKDFRPCKPSSKVRVSLYASFELGPMLCHGDLLRTFEISVGESLDRSEKSHPTIFQPKQEEVVSACTSLLMTLEQRLSDENDAAVLCPLTTLISDDMRALLRRTDAGHDLLARYRRMQNHRDLDQSINHFECALGLCSMNHPYRPAALFNLATAKFVSCQADGRHLDLDIPIDLFQDALNLRPTDHPDRTVTQLHLAIALLSRFAKRRSQTDADAAEELLSEVLDACPANSHIYRAALIAVESSALHSTGSIITNNLGQERLAASVFPLSLNQLADRVKRCLRIDDPHALDEVISLHYDALGYYNAGHAYRGKLLGNLSVLLQTRFRRRGNDEDLDQAIALHKEALALHPVGHTDRPMLLNNLANRLSSRFQHRGNDEDLDQAIALHKEALALRPVGHTDRSMSLNNLATELSSRFEHRGDDEDLDQAIALHREALALRPVGHTDRSMSLNSLANRLSSRFEHRGNDEDLDQAIALHREALALRPAIALRKEVLALRPVGHTDRSGSLNNLAIELSSRFKHRGDDEDLDQAIALHREALALRPVGHTYRSESLYNLANGLSSRFEHRGDDEDLDQAIVLHREALALFPVGHTYRSMSLNNLATELSSRFEHRGNREDLDESRENLYCALTLLTQHDPRQLVVHGSLATVYLSFHHSRLDGTGAGEDTGSLNAAMYNLKAAAIVVSAGTLSRLRASLRWVQYASQHSHGTELEAYATSMQLLDAYMSTTASVSSRHNIMKDFPSTLAVDAASRALRSGDVCRAVELLEQGRTIIWTQMTRLRTPLDSLQTRGDHAAALMKKFRDLSSLLDKPPANYPEATPRVNVEAEETRYRRLVEDWNRAVEDIRKIEGFSRFLLPPLFSYLQDAARDGPIIMLIASELSCDAIIIPHKQPPTCIQLPTNLEKLQTLVVKLQRTSSPALIKALMELWDDVVRPVVENLGGFAGRGCRIWWCPTSVFNFLPLHAAGDYRKHGQILSQLYISSYTPSLTALIKARRSRDRSLSVSFAAIGQNRPAGASFTLDCVEPELELVQSLLPPPPTISFTKITSVDATRSRALRTLQDNTWLHFSCHGTQAYKEPFKSAFLVRDQPLSLLDITQMDLSRHQFAFLSACETAVGDLQTPDEVVHLAAGLQFAGVKSVIGTLWKVDDSTVQRLVKAFYKNLCGDGTMNSKRAARALHRAVQSLAGDKDMPLDQRIVFVHIGI